MNDDEAGGSLSIEAPVRRRRFDCFMACCRTLNVVTGICAVLCLAAHAMAIIAGNPIFNDTNSLQRQSLRIYGIGFSLLVAVVETEWQVCLSQLRILDGWTARGLLQVFLSVLTLDIATAVGNDDFDKSVRLYRIVAGTSLLCCGGIYVLGGLLCLGKIKRAQNRKALEKGRLERDLQTLKRRQEELHGLLSVYTAE